MKIQDQPPPVARPDLVPVWQLVIHDYTIMVAGDELDHDSTDRRVIADMKERDDLGRVRYKAPLTAFNGRNHLVDAYQEVLDASVYLRAWLEEHEAETDKRRVGYAVYRQIREHYTHHLRMLWNLRRLIEDTAPIEDLHRRTLALATAETADAVDERLAACSGEHAAPACGDPQCYHGPGTPQTRAFPDDVQGPDR